MSAEIFVFPTVAPVSHDEPSVADLAARLELALGQLESANGRLTSAFGRINEACANLLRTTQTRNVAADGADETR